MKRLFILAIAAFSTLSCSKYTLTSSGALNGKNLADYTTFTMQVISAEDLPKGVDDTDLARLYRALGSELTARGYSYVKEGSGDADLTIHVGLSTRDHIETSTTNNGYVGGVGYPSGFYGRYNYYGATPYVHGYYGGTSTTTTELVTDGALIVDLVANSDNTHVFYSQIKASIDGKQLILKDYAELAKVAEKVFRRFPIDKQ